MTTALRLAFAGHPTDTVQRVPRHAHAAPIVVWYTRGSGEIAFDDRVERFRRGSVAWIPAGVPYAESSTRGFISLYIAAHGLPIAIPRVDAAGDDPCFAHSARLVLALARRASIPQRDVSLGLALTLLVRSVPRSEAARTDVLVERALAVLRERWPEPSFGLAALARAVGAPPRRLRRRFLAALGTTPLHWLRARRIEEARRLLADGGLPVGEVARRVGFADPYHFSRVVRRETGASPSALRPAPRA